MCVRAYTRKKKQSAEYARILNVSDAVHSKGHCTNYWEVIEIDTYSGDGQTFKMTRFAKRIMPDCRCATRNFSGQEVGEISSKTPEKEVPQGTNFGVFSPRYS